MTQKNIKYYSNQQLCRSPKSRVEKVQLLLEHRSARNQFSILRCIEEAPLEQVFPGISHTRTIIQSAVPAKGSFGNMPSAELIVIATICSYLKPKTIFEFGTYNGLTTLHLALNSPPETRVFTIDLSADDPIRKTMTDDSFYTVEITVGEQFHNQLEASKITQIFGDTTKYDHQALRGKVDMIFIDAGHTYDLVKSDTQKALDMLAPGGVILWHDYFYTQVGVYTWLNELHASLPVMNIPGTTLIYYVKPN
jgi:predicted O-methyltransferase YrrM